MQKPFLVQWIFFFIFSTFFQVNSQGQIKNLLFNSAHDVIRLNFSDLKNPVPLNTGNNSGGGIGEGIAHYENSEGKILFYVNSGGVFNMNDDIMPGSETIYFSASSTEIVICPYPEHPNQFLIIYNYDQCSNLYYSIINMSLNDSLGGIEELNVPLDDKNFAEGLELIGIPGTKEFWLIAYECGEAFYRFRVTKNGIGQKKHLFNYTIPAGAYSGRGEIDYFRGKLAAAFVASPYSPVLIANFNAYDGKLFNPTTILIHEDSIQTSINRTIYGLEFSPDGKMLFVSDWQQYKFPNLYQIQLSSFEIVNKWTFPRPVGQIELGPNGKLYMPLVYGNQIISVSNPNSKKPYIDSIRVKSTLSYGVSDFVQSAVYSKPQIQFARLCFGDSSLISFLADKPIDSLEWKFGDPPFAIKITHRPYTSHLFSSPGDFKISVTVYYKDSKVETFSDTINIIDSRLPDIDLGKDTFLCRSNYFTLGVNNREGTNFMWQDSSTNNTCLVDRPGIYWLKAHNVCREKIDSITILQYFPSADFEMFIDSCKKEVQFTNNSSEAFYYKWEFGDGKSSTLPHPRHVFQDYQKYSIRLTSLVRENCYNQAEKEVDFSFFDKFYFPTAFSPNSDGINDRFIIKGKYFQCSDIYFTIFNRWGEILYQITLDSKIIWDGNYKGNKVPPGAYFYYLEKDKVMHSGSFLILE